MVNYKLLILLEKVLGQGKPTSGTNYAFFSPFCSHYKPKLEINLETVNGSNPWHCWISNEKGKTIRSLFRRLNASREIFEELFKIVEDKKFSSRTEQHTPAIELPKGFVPLHSIDKKMIKLPAVKNALLYLHKRNISSNDIKRYNIGICIEGEYSNTIVIPSYDSDGILNYFVCRSFLENSYVKYKNPKASKNIVPFDLYINWDFPIIITEGVFDAIAIKVNAIPLLGKSISPALKEKIIKNRVSDLYIALDNDAIKDSIKMIKYFLNQGINVYYVDLKEKDPSALGHLQFHTEMAHAKKCSYESVIKMELSI